MSDFEPRDWLTERLHTLGAQPIDPAAQSQHLTAMAEAAVAPSLLGTLGSRLRIAAAVGVGVLLGATGLTTAGALGPLQPIASRAVEAATPLDVPNDGHGHGKGKSADAHDASETHASGKDDAPGQERVTEGCEAGISTRNRGLYLKGVREKYGEDSAELEAAKATRCGMPVDSEGTPGADDDDESTVEDSSVKGAAHDEDGEHGKSGESHGKSGDAPGQAVNDDGPGQPADVPGDGTGLEDNDAPDPAGADLSDPDGDHGGGESDTMDPAGPPTSVPVGDSSGSGS